jgi:hypothetical protein
MRKSTNSLYRLAALGLFLNACDESRTPPENADELDSSSAAKSSVETLDGSESSLVAIPSASSTQEISSADITHQKDTPDLLNGICIAQDLAKGISCQIGQRIMFLPPRFGNKQLPIMFAGFNCDFRYAIALTDGAVACIYRPSELNGFIRR